MMNNGIFETEWTSQYVNMRSVVESYIEQQLSDNNLLNYYH